MAVGIGRVCIKTAGREAGRACVVIDTIDETYVMITGPKGLTRVRRRKCNIAHLEPLGFQLKLAKNAPDNEVSRLLQAEKILDKVRAGKPAPGPERPREEKAEKPGAPEKGRKGLRERILGRARKEEKPKEEKKPEPKEGPKKPEKPKAEKKHVKPKERPKPEKKKSAAKEKPKPARKARPKRKK